VKTKSCLNGPEAAQKSDDSFFIITSICRQNCLNFSSVTHFLPYRTSYGNASCINIAFFSQVLTMI